MARGPLKVETKAARAFAALNKILADSGVAPEELPTIRPQVPLESSEDFMREGQSALNYYAVRGVGFKQKECTQCGLVFAYDYHIEGIKYCSIRCIKRALNAIGLEYDPTREVGRRWGRFVPAVVTHDALQILQEVPDEDSSLADLLEEINNEEGF